MIFKRWRLPECSGQVCLPCEEVSRACAQRNGGPAPLNWPFEKREVHSTLTVLDRERPSVGGLELEFLNSREAEHSFVPLLGGSAVGDVDVDVIDRPNRRYGCCIHGRKGTAKVVL